MGKASAARYYVPAWFVWVIALMAYVAVRQHEAADPFIASEPGVSGLALIIVVLSLTMVAIWVSVLVRLARQHDWGWFGAVVLIHLVGLGVIAIGAYSLLGPPDVDVSRPSVE